MPRQDICLFGIPCHRISRRKGKDYKYEKAQKDQLCDMTPEIRTLISGVIFMTKYTKEIKLAIYHEWVNDYRRGTYLSRKYGMGRGGIQYLVGLI